ncbi:MAG TPA: tRNA (N(6)-L-threonylcarbamoyladenosine(37)-C(2))-methylthiotransferase MtaB [Chloroflexi bacterium]|nr:tRNA (N(6)-L-threonylcarbamoyladenosine(37)-C(2))-methylthiotransferase MtaB [Chloroflexota bacterium]
MSTQTSPRIAFTTLGCKVNQSETDLLARQFAAAGYDCVSFEENADVYVVNTCTVTHVADKKSRQMLSQARRANPEALVVATGCYASIVGHQLAGDRTLVIRNRDKDHVVELVGGSLGRAIADTPTWTDLEKCLTISGGQERARPMVKAQDGCDSHCTYCIIPRARGRSRSVPVDDVVLRVQALVDEGHSEVVITGVDLGSYGQGDSGLPDLGGLLQEVLDRTSVQRLRVSSVEPGDFDAAWLSLWQNPRLCRHLHIPLQSGSLTVLERMERSYTPEQFAGMVAQCRSSIPGLTVTTDVITGFPGETNQEFGDGLQFIHALHFDGMHVFKYSRRSGTRAAHLPDQVPEPVKAERSRVLRQEALAGVNRLLARHEGVTATIAWESDDGGAWRGLSDTNVRVYGSAEITRQSGLGLCKRVLTSPFRDGLWSEPQGADIMLVPVS